MSTRKIILIIALSITVGISVEQYNNVAAEKSIPNWIKNVAKSWGENQISNSEFINSIQWLIDQKILIVQSKSESVTSQLQNQTISTQDLLPTQSDIRNEWNAGKIYNIKNDGSTKFAEGFVESFSQTLTRNNSNETIHVEISSYDSTSNAKKYYDFVIQQFGGWVESPADESIQDMCWSADSTNTSISQSEMVCHHGKFFILLISMKDNSFNSKHDLNKFAEIMLNKIWLIVNVNTR